MPSSWCSQGDILHSDQATSLLNALYVSGFTLIYFTYHISYSYISTPSLIHLQTTQNTTQRSRSHSSLGRSIFCSPLGLLPCPRCSRRITSAESSYSCFQETSLATSEAAWWSRPECPVPPGTNASWHRPGAACLLAVPRL